MNCIGIVALIVVFFCFYTIVVNTEEELDMKNDTIEDYTLMIRNIPKIKSSLADIKELLDYHDLKPYEIYYTYKMRDYINNKTELLRFKRMYCECLDKNV